MTPGDDARFRWREHSSPAALAGALAAHVAKVLAAGIETRGRATLAVSGGTTPVNFFRALSAIPLDWRKVTVTLVDERFVAPDSPRSNARLVRENLLRGEAAHARFIPFVSATAMPPPTPPRKGEGSADAGDSPSPLWGSEGRARQATRPGKARGGGETSDETPEEAAKAASSALRNLLPFDMVVLGMGTDGHTASFFPDAGGLAMLLDPGGTRVVLPVAAPSAGEPRLTLSLPAIVTAADIVLHIEGEAKRIAFEAAMDRDALPARPIRTVVEAAASPPLVFWAPSEGSQP